MKQVQQTAIPKKVADYIRDRDVYCQNEDCNNKYQNLTIHHICPRSHYGSGKNPCNLILLCIECHDRVYELAKKYPYLLASTEENLIHREQIPFYDHIYPKDYIKCSHEKNNKRSEA